MTKGHKHQQAARNQKPDQANLQADLIAQLEIAKTRIQQLLDNERLLQNKHNQALAAARRTTAEADKLRMQVQQLNDELEALHPKVGRLSDDSITLRNDNLFLRTYLDTVTAQAKNQPRGALTKLQINSFRKLMERVKQHNDGITTDLDPDIPRSKQP